MRILFLISRYPPLSYGGHYERCRQTVSMLARRGHSIQVLTSNHRLPSQGLRGERGVRRRLLLNGPPQEAFRRQVKRQKVNIGLMHDTLVAFKPDCIFVWDMGDLPKSILFFLQGNGVPLLFDLHSPWLVDDFQRDPWNNWWLGPAKLRHAVFRRFLRMIGRARSLRRLYPWGEAEAVDLTNAFVCSDVLKGRLADSGLPVDQLEVLYPATDEHLIPGKLSYTGTKRFMWAGRLSPEKDPDTVIEAVGILRRRGHPISLYLYIQGEQIDRKRLRARIDEAGAGSYIHIRHIRPAELLAEFAEFDGVISTSGPTDPFPMTPIEAMLAAVPCILARGGAVCEVVKEDEHCLLFEFGSPESLAATLEKYCEKPDHGADMGRRCREWLQQRHALSTCIPEIEKRLAVASRSQNGSDIHHGDDGNAESERGGVRP